MLVSERERVRYDDQYAYRPQDDRIARYDYENRYEADRLRTSSSYRDSLMESLERPATRTRLERSDEARYSFYMSNIGTAENNYDKFWDRKHANENRPARRRNNRVFVAAYMLVALIAILAVSLSVIGLGRQETVMTKNLTPISASAEDGEGEIDTGAAALEGTEAPVLLGGENYILLSSGEVVAVEIPSQAKGAKEKQNGFDKFCNWLNGVFGG
ncbi:MAG TPA: hypothetical protein DIC18_01610 [Clostridiales bacterium]|nr:hypothetical protein [Clostridiales bacterium]HCU56014.1 hypothetical protein [Clostridiales bacterium]